MGWLIAGILLVASCGPTVLPTPTVTPVRMVRGVLVDRAIVSMDVTGKLVVTADGKSYWLRLSQNEQGSWRAALEPKTD